MRGALRTSPPSRVMSVVPVRAPSTSTTSLSPVSATPVATLCSSTPATLWVFIAASPASMSPDWLTSRKPTVRRRSTCASASTAP